MVQLWWGTPPRLNRPREGLGWPLFLLAIIPRAPQRRLPRPPTLRMRRPGLKKEGADGGAASNYSSFPKPKNSQAGREVEGDKGDLGAETESGSMNWYDGAFVCYFSQKATMNLARIDAMFARAVFVMWLSLLGLVYNLTPERSFRRLSEMEYNSAILCVVGPVRESRNQVHPPLPPHVEQPWEEAAQRCHDRGNHGANRGHKLGVPHGLLPRADPG